MFSSFYPGESKEQGMPGSTLLPKICPTLENPSQSQRGWGRSWTPHVVQGLLRALKGSDWVTNPYANPCVTYWKNWGKKWENLTQTLL